MDGCKQIKRAIDDDAVSFEASQHLASCAECSAFARQRARLRELIAGAGRVSAPADFDFKLTARLREVKEQRQFRWLSPAGYLRMGAATAALVIAVVAAQTGNFFSGDEQPAQSSVNPVANALPPGVADATGKTPESPLSPQSNSGSVMPGRKHPIAGALPISVRNIRRQARPAVPVEGYVADDGTVVLMRGPAGEREVPVPTVSVGAQSLLYVNSGRPVARSISTSF